MCVKLHFYLIILAIYFYAIHKLDLFAYYYLFAIFHELAHILIALLTNVKIKEIDLLPVGVCAKYDYIDRRIKEVIIAAAGPLFSVILGLISNSHIISIINFSIAFLNLIPIYPLDGGRIVRAIIELKFGYRKSVLISNKIAQFLLIVLTVVGVLIFAYFKNFSLVFIDIYIFFLIQEELKKERILKIINSLIGE